MADHVLNILHASPFLTVIFSSLRSRVLKLRGAGLSSVYYTVLAELASTTRPDVEKPVKTVG